ISSFFSIIPEYSLLGIQSRVQGAYTHLCIAIIELLTATHLRYPQQWVRIQSVIIFTSVPVAAYGLLQFLNKDPLALQISERVVANLGNAVFFAAYLSIAFFVTAERFYTILKTFGRYILFHQMPERQNDEDVQNWPYPVNVQESKKIYAILGHLGGISFYVLLMGLQLTALSLTQSRGPLIGLLVGLGFAFVLACATIWQNVGRKLLLTAILLGCIEVVAVGLYSSPLRFQEGASSQLSAINTMLNTVTAQFTRPDSRTLYSRFLMWQGVEELYTQDDPFQTITQEPDRLARWRPLIGYGPETLGLLFQTVYPIELFTVEERSKVVDRAHNETWDQLISLGLLGYAAYYALLIQVFYWGLRWLALLVRKRDTILFLCLIGFSVISLTTMAVLYTQSWFLIGFVMPMGLLLGLLLYLLTAIFRPRRHPSATQTAHYLSDHSPTTSQQSPTLLILCLSIVICHLVETSVGMSITTTKLYVWFFVAVLFVVGQGRLREYTAPTVQTEPSSENGFGFTTKLTRWQSPVFEHSLLFTTLVYIYVNNNLGDSNWLVLLLNAFTHSVNLAGGYDENMAVAWLFLGTWIAGMALIVHHGTWQRWLGDQQAVNTDGWRDVLLHLVVYNAVLWGLALLFGVVQANRLVVSDNMSVYSLHINRANQFAFYTWGLVLWLLIAAAFSMQWGPRATLFQRSIGRSDSQKKQRQQGGYTYPIKRLGVLASTLVLAGVGIAVIQTIHIQPIYANSLFGAAQVTQVSYPDTSFTLYQEAIKRDWTEAQYRVTLATWLLQLADSAEESQSADDSTANVAVLYADGVDAQSRIAQTEPLSRPLEDFLSMDRAELLDHVESLLSPIIVQNPLEINSHLLLSRIHHRQAKLAAASQESTQAQHLLASSLHIADGLAAFSTHLTTVLNHRGDVLVTSGHLDEAEAAYQETLAVEPWNWAAHQALISLYAQRQQPETLIAFVRQTIEANVIGERKSYPNIAYQKRTEARNNRETFLYTTLIYTFYQMGDVEGTLDVAFEFQEKQPWNYFALRTLVQLHMQMEEYAEAVLWSTRALLWVPDLSLANRIELYEVRIELYRLLNDTIGLRQTYEELRTYLPEDTEILNNLYQLYMEQPVEQRDITKIAEVLQSLMQYEPHNYQHPLHLAELLKEAKNLVDARTLAEHALTLASEDEQQIVVNFLAELE
ncbi:MAG: hypothetical protein AAF639_17085, partial [Chloroflexota bacterium]